MIIAILTCGAWNSIWLIRIVWVVNVKLAEVDSQGIGTDLKIASFVAIPTVAFGLSMKSADPNRAEFLNQFSYDWIVLLGVFISFYAFVIRNLLMAYQEQRQVTSGRTLSRVENRGSVYMREDNERQLKDALFKKDSPEAVDFERYAQ